MSQNHHAALSIRRAPHAARAARRGGRSRSTGPLIEAGRTERIEMESKDMLDLAKRGRRRPGRDDRCDALRAGGGGAQLCDARPSVQDWPPSGGFALDVPWIRRCRWPTGRRLICSTARAVGIDVSTVPISRRRAAAGGFRAQRYLIERTANQPASWRPTDPRNRRQCQCDHRGGRSDLHGSGGFRPGEARPGATGLLLDRNGTCSEFPSSASADRFRRSSAVSRGLRALRTAA